MKIAILSNGNVNYSTLRLKEEAERRGHSVRVIKYRKCYVTIDEKNPTVMYDGEAIDQYDAIIPRIASYMTRYGTAVARQLEMAYPRTLFVNRSIAITRARDKLRSTQLLARGGVAIPKTVFSRNSADIDDLLNELGGTPVIIKLARGTHGNGVVLAETKKAAKSVLQAFSAMFVVDAEASLKDNVAAMTEASANIRYAEITTAVRDSTAANGDPIHNGDVMGIQGSSIDVVGHDVDDVTLRLLSQMQEEEEGDTLTLLAGSDMDDAHFSALTKRIEEAFPDLEVDAHRGEQPLYPIIFSLE